MGFLSSTSQGSLSNNVIYPYLKEWSGVVNKKVIIVPESKIPREISLYSDKLINIYYGNQSIDFYSIKNQVFIDSNCGTSLIVEPLEGETNVKILIRSTKRIVYNIGVEEIMIPVEVNLAVGTGNNFVDVNISNYDANNYQYLINLNKLKNSDSNITGFKLFDITSFYPGKWIEFNVQIDSNDIKYDIATIAAQLFDPLIVGEVLLAIANDVVNLELNNISESFVGSLTRNATYQAVINNKLNIKPNFSKHIGRFIARNTNTLAYDTVIIKEYIPNQDKYLGGTFILTGDF